MGLGDRGDGISTHARLAGDQEGQETDFGQPVTVRGDGALVVRRDRWEVRR